MERTFSSPSIFGLPNSSSFTCCRKQSRAEFFSQAGTMLWGLKPQPARIAQCLGDILTSSALGCRSSWEQHCPCQGEPTHEHRTTGDPRSSSTSLPGQDSGVKAFSQGLGSRKQNPLKIAIFQRFPQNKNQGYCSFDSHPEPRLEILERLEPNPRVGQFVFQLKSAHSCCLVQHSYRATGINPLALFLQEKKYCEASLLLRKRNI